jgi:hypothetical protein
MARRSRRPWQPLLDGAEARRARAAIEELARHLDGAPVASASLLDGAAGRALVFAYLAEAFPGHGHDERVERWIDRAVELLPEEHATAALFTGYTGVGWLFAHLECGDGDDATGEIDRTLYDELCAPPGAEVLEHDLVHGLAGIGVYAIERLPDASAAELLRLLVERLGQAAVPRPDGITWRTAPTGLPVETAAKYPQGYDDMGVAHGAPGPMAVLAAAAAARIAPERAEELLDGSFRWMLANRLPAGEDSAFPYWRAERSSPVPARSAWCYGDPGAARALYVSARAVGDALRAEAALAIARRALHRPRERTGCVEPGLCHGAIGLSHLANRMWQDTGEPSFAEAARHWCVEALAMARPADPSLLDGAAGLALALAAAMAPIEPGWDRLFLISLPAPVGP